MTGLTPDVESNTKLQSQVLLLLNWRCRAIRASHGQYLAADLLARNGTILTCINILTAIAVLFLTNNRFFALASDTTSVNGDWSWLSNEGLAALAGLFVVLSTALQYILRLDEKSKDSKRAGNDFTELKRRIETLLVNGTDINASTIAELELLHTHTSRYHAIVPRKIWRRAHRLGDKNINGEADFEIQIRARYGLTEFVPKDSQPILYKWWEFWR